MSKRHVPVDATGCPAVFPLKRRMRGLRTAFGTAVLLVGSVLSTAMPAAAVHGGDTLVSVGSPSTPFSQNKQNEPALAVDQHRPSVLVAGANDNIDMEACNAGDDTTCPFTSGVGVSGVYFSFDSGDTWTQPTYTGLTARNCLGAIGSADADCSPQPGPIGTLPGYYEHGLVSDGDPALAFGPRPDASGHFSWDNGSRLYYANLANSTSGAIKGFEAIAVSRTDEVAAAAQGHNNAWLDPVIVSKQSSTTFADKEQIWADNAASSTFFGTVYVCWAEFRSRSHGGTPLMVATSSDGGATWRLKQVSSAISNPVIQSPDGCTIRTDSTGTAYVFGVASDPQTKQKVEVLYTSTDGGEHWSQPRTVAGPLSLPGEVDPVLQRSVLDGVAGARDDLAWAPSVDIANGAPSGTDATNKIVMTYVSGRTASPHAWFTESSNGGTNWSAPRAIERPGDRAYYAAPAISPDGTDVYVTYNAFTTPYRDTTASPRALVGVMLNAPTGAGTTGAFSELHRSAPGDPRGSSQNNLEAEFLGDYVYAVATRDYGAAVWNDVRNAADCPAVDAWRMALRTGDTSTTHPAPQQDCPASFGNTDIFGGSYAEPRH